jgi:hypothetical protein
MNAAVSRQLQDSMPIWYHRFSSGDRRFFNASTNVVKCLKEKDGIRFVIDTRILARKPETPRLQMLSPSLTSNNVMPASKQPLPATNY